MPGVSERNGGSDMARSGVCAGLFASWAAPPASRYTYSSEAFFVYNTL